MYCTPSLEAIHVVPQKKQTMANAKYALALVPFFTDGKWVEKRNIPEGQIQVVLCVADDRFGRVGFWGHGNEIVDGEWSIVNGQW